MLDPTYIHRFLTSLGFTALVETAVLVALLLYVFKKREIPITNILTAGFFASASTIPYVWFVFPYIIDWPRNTSFLVSEPFAVIVEAFVYKTFLRLDIRVALALSLICNLASFILGPLLRGWGLWIYW